MKPSDQLPIQKIYDLQFQQFRAHFEQVCANSPYYSQKFKALGITPSDITSWQDLHKLPILDTKALLANNAALPAVPHARLRRVIVSGGTTGSPKICFFADNMHEIIQIWAPVWQAAELTKEDMVVILCPIPLASGMMITQIVEAIGCTSLPVGITTQPEFAARLMEKLDATVIVSQPSTLQNFTEQIKTFNYYPKDFNVRKIFLGSEVLTQATRRRVEKEWNCEVFDTSGSSEVGMIGSECTAHNGHHLAVGSAYFEVLGLETGKPVTEGVGHLYITTLLNIGLPLIRYDMKDIVKITNEPCQCGRTTPRIWFMGRADDRLVLKTGVKFYSYQVDEALASFEEVTISYNVIATDDHQKDSIKLVIEAQAAAHDDRELKRRIAQAIIKSSVDFNEIYCSNLVNDPEVEFVPIGALERTGRGKIKNRFQDLRSVKTH
ncbi:MAG: phenylacetate--CoA ligase family protein [Limisphaerales bacterium]